MTDALPKPSQPVDLKHLREMTDGEKDIEKELFSLFFSNAEECISVLRNNCLDGESQLWRGAAHELKGSSASLGAFKLSQVCHHAQNIFTAPAAEKAPVIQAIEIHLKEVKLFLDKLA